MMSTGQDSTVDDPTETSTVEVATQTTGSGLTSSSSLGADLYFRCAVLLLGVVGAAANGLVLYAMVAAKQHKKHVLIFSQNALDLVNCMAWVIGYSINLSSIYLSGTGGYWLCLTIMSYAGALAAYSGSQINLAAISIERYLKIVHHVWAKAKLRNWMIYSTIAFAWIAGIVIAAADIIPTAVVINGVCYSGFHLLNPTIVKARLVWEFLSLYVTIILIFTYCYGRILVVIRRQARVMAAHSGHGSNTVQDQTKKIQNSVIKTMILVGLLITVTWAPLYTYLLHVYFGEISLDENVLSSALFIAYLYVCINPFIYATKFAPVKRVLWGLITRKKNVHAAESGGNT